MRETWFLDRSPEDVDGALEALNAFYRCGEEPQTGGGEGGSRPYSLWADAGAIVADFNRVYAVDLTTEKLHWWRFCALLGGLLGPNLAQRADYRLAKLGEIKDKRLRAHYSKMKEYYALDASGQKQRRPQTLEEYNQWLLSGGRG